MQKKQQMETDVIPAILNNLLDYEDFEKRRQDPNKHTSYIWVKKGKKEEAWAVCSLLGMVVDGDVKVDGYPVVNTYIFVRIASSNKADHYAIGIEGRFHLHDLLIYFEQWETDNAT